MARIALVTGGNRGLGLATARRLGEHGATVIVGARDAARGAHAVRTLREAGIDAEGVALDVTDLTSVRAAADEVRRRHRRLDVLVNNAGVLPEATAADADAPIDLELLRRTFETNVFGAAAVAQAFLPLLRLSEAGRIVNVSSTMGSLADQLDPASPFHGLVVPGYQASKAALNALTVSLSKALADTAVKVNSVCPGWVQTDLGGSANRAAAPLTAEEAARIVVAAATPAADTPTGAFLSADGRVAW
jgi:NAD(P)-dependent dehydrogenase (short-subunit alcohol dehydrogenase family)